MRNLSTLLLGVLISISAFCQAKTVPYESILYQDADWTTIDVNNDRTSLGQGAWNDSQSSVYFSGSDAGRGKAYQYHSSNTADDWLCSPAISLEAGNSYKIAFFMGTAGYNEVLNVYAATSNTPDAFKATTPILSLPAAKNVRGIQIIEFTPAESGEFYIGFHCTSPKDLNYVAITDFSIKSNVIIPGVPTNLSYTSGTENELKATLTWNLPIVDAYGQPLDAGTTFENVILTRDDVEVARLDGNATTWEDNAANGLIAGKHHYEVTVTIAGRSSSPASLDTEWIGPKPTFDVPYVAPISTLTQEDFDFLWNVDKSSASTGGYKFELIEDYYEDNYIRYYGISMDYSPTKADEWLITPTLNFPAAGNYRVIVKYDYNPTSKDPFTLDLLLGNGTDVSVYSTKIGETTALGLGQMLEANFYVSEACQHNIAFHLTADKCFSTLKLYSLEVEATVSRPAHVTELSAKPQGENQVLVSWTWPAVDNSGSPLQKITKGEVYRDDELIMTITSNITPGAAASFSDTPGKDGVFSYKVIPYLDELAPEGDAPVAVTPWIGDETREIPYSIQFGTDETKAMWTTLNANGDEYQWSMADDAVLNLDVNDDVTPTNDYLVSPYMNMERGFYEVTYAVKGSNAAQFEIGLVADKENIAGTFTNLATITGASEYDYSTCKAVILVNEAGRYALALHAAMDIPYSTIGAIMVKSFDIKSVDVFPNRPENLTCTPATDCSLSAELQWTNPTTSSVQGVEPIITKAVISRKAYGADADYAVVAELTDGLVAGEGMQWTDDAVPADGVYDYSVILHGITGAGEEGDYVTYISSVTSSRIGKPYEAPFTTESSFVAPEWIVVKGGGRNSWGFKDSDPNTLASMNAYDFRPDDWLISPKVNFKDNYIYKLTVNTSMDSFDSSLESLEWVLCLGDESVADSMNLRIADVATASRVQSAPQSDIYYLSLQPESDEYPQALQIEPGAHMVGLHAINEGKLFFHGMSIEVEKDDSYLSVDGIATDERAEQVSVYNLQGIKVAEAMNCSLNDMRLESGIYIVKMAVKGRNITRKITIK